VVSMQHDTSDVIVEGAMRALARHGTSRLSMTDIYRESQVSRGTLYRYFANREAVLDAVNTQIMSSMRATFDQAVAEHPDPSVRIRVMLHAMIEFPGRFPHMHRLIEHEPASAIGFLARELPHMVGILTEYLAPALEAAPPVVNGSMTCEELAEIFQRLVTSTFLIPSPGSDTLDVHVADMWDSLLASSTPAARRSRAPARRRTGSRTAD